MPDLHRRAASDRAPEPGDRGAAARRWRSQVRLRLRILLAGNAPMLRGALTALIELEPDLEVIEEVSTGEQILSAALRCRPDVAVIDIDLPVLDGVSAAVQLHERLPSCRTLILANVQRPGAVRRALSAQVGGYLVKDSQPEELARAVRRVAAGQRVIDPLSAEAARGAHDLPLSPRELQILRLAARGDEPDTIAAQLCLSVGTVRNYLTAVVVKLGARNRVDAIRLAQESGWIS